MVEDSAQRVDIDSFPLEFRKYKKRGTKKGKFPFLITRQNPSVENEWTFRSSLVLCCPAPCYHPTKGVSINYDTLILGIFEASFQGRNYLNVFGGALLWVAYLPGVLCGVLPTCQGLCSKWELQFI